MTKTGRNVLAAAALSALLLVPSLVRSWGMAGVNVRSQPVQGADAERLARVPYQSFSTNSGCVGVAANCTFIFTPAPSGYRLIVENISGWFQLSASAVAPPVVLLKDASLNAGLGFTGALGQSLGGSVLAAFNQPTRAYFDPADGSIFASVTGSFPAISSPQRMTLTGYLENCSVTGCPRIQR